MEQKVDGVRKERNDNAASMKVQLDNKLGRCYSHFAACAHAMIHTRLGW
jgi:hypothetical protein